MDGVNDEEEGDYEMQRHKETEDDEDEEIGQEKAEGGEMEKMMNRTKKSPQRKNETIEENYRDSEVETNGTKTGRFPCNECDSVFSVPYIH